MHHIVLELCEQNRRNAKFDQRTVTVRWMVAVLFSGNFKRVMFKLQPNLQEETFLPIFCWKWILTWNWMIVPSFKAYTFLLCWGEGFEFPLCSDWQGYSSHCSIISISTSPSGHVWSTAAKTLHRAGHNANPQSTLVKNKTKIHLLGRDSFISITQTQSPSPFSSSFEGGCFGNKIK